MSSSDGAALFSIVLERFPALDGRPYRVPAGGWSCAALDVDDRLIFKFPRDEPVRAALAREAGLLGVLRGRLSMRVPDLVLHPGPPAFSSHAKIPGRHLLTTDYEALPEPAKRRLGQDLGRFYAELHGLDVAEMAAAGALPIGAWAPVDEIGSRALPLLPDALRPEAVAVLEAYAALPRDPLGEVFGFFDGHGWNMAFDHGRLRLNGVYDFGDSGLGPAHRDFVYSSLVSADLTARIMAAYEAESGRPLDRRRVDVLTGTHRLWELADLGCDPTLAPAMVRGVAAWQSHRAASPQ